MKCSPALAVAFLAGFSGMVLELTAVRLLAPFFGASVYVWTNVIGVTLAALATGAWIGGCLADRSSSRLVLGALLGCAGGLTLLVPLLAPALAGALLPPGLRLEEAFGILIEGSLATSIAIFGPPLFLVGMTSPILVRQLVDGGQAVGRGSGSVWALSTIGSLLGTFGTTHLFVPHLGSRLTLMLAGVLLLLAGLTLVALARHSRVLVALLALAALGLGSDRLGALHPGRSPGPGIEVLAQRESPYQFLRIVRSAGDDQPWASRMLQVNEGLDSFQSLIYEGRLFTDAYYDPLAVTPLLLPARARELDVLIIGLGGGTLVPILREVVAPLVDELRITGIEIDPVVIELAREYLGLDPSQVRIISDLDGRVGLAHLPQRWDVILLDAYASQVHIPPHLASEEFFELVAERLEEDGLVACNVGMMGSKDPVKEAIANTMARVFGCVWSWPVPWSRNAILVAARSGTIEWKSFQAAVSRRLDLPISPGAGNAEDVRGRLRAMALHASLPGVVTPHVYDAGGALLRDDDTLLDVLQMEAIEGRAP